MKENFMEVCDMTYKQIEAARETRLWISQVIIPAIAVVGTIMSIPETRQAVTDKYDKVKQAINKKLKRQ